MPQSTCASTSLISVQLWLDEERNWAPTSLISVQLWLDEERTWAPTHGVFSKNACACKGRHFDVLCIMYLPTENLVHKAKVTYPNAVQSKGCMDYYSTILVAITMVAITMVTGFCPLSMFETHRGSRNLLPIITVYCSLISPSCEELCMLTYNTQLINHDNQLYS